MFGVPIHAWCPQLKSPCHTGMTLSSEDYCKEKLLWEQPERVRISAGNKTQVHLGSSCLWTRVGAMSGAFSSNHRGKHKYEERRSLKDNFIAKTRLKNSSDSKTKLFKACFYEFNEVFNVQSIAFFLNTDRREVQYLKYLKFFFDKPEGFVARSVYNQKTR